MTTYFMERIEAAVRIKELVEENKELTLQLLAASGQAADALDRTVVAEAKLTKAVEALQFFAAFESVFARAVLAELEAK